MVAQIALLPNGSEQVGRIVFYVTDLSGKVLGEFKAKKAHELARSGNFAVREARWPATLAAPGRFQVQAIVYDACGTEFTRVAPRLVSVNIEPGYKPTTSRCRHSSDVDHPYRWLGGTDVAVDVAQSEAEERAAFIADGFGQVAGSVRWCSRNCGACRSS